jgi:hypothetical protein
MHLPLLRLLTRLGNLTVPDRDQGCGSIFRQRRHGRTEDARSGLSTYGKLRNPPSSNSDDSSKAMVVASIAPIARGLAQTAISMRRHATCPVREPCGDDVPVPSARACNLMIAMSGHVARPSRTVRQAAAQTVIAF